jgi:hypothetical protein
MEDKLLSLSVKKQTEALYRYLLSMGYIDSKKKAYTTR